MIAGHLSDARVPVFVADVKRDLSGLAQPIDAADPKVAERAASLGWTVEPRSHPVEPLSRTGEAGAPVRATVESFGPVLLAKVLDLNETQTAVLSLVFRFCDDRDLPLLDLADLRTTLRFLTSDEGKPVLEEYRGISKASVGVVLRSILTLEEAGAGDGEWTDLLRDGEARDSDVDGRDVAVRVAVPRRRQHRSGGQHRLVHGRRHDQRSDDRLQGLRVQHDRLFEHGLVTFRAERSRPTALAPTIGVSAGSSVWTERLPSKQRVAGSSPARRTSAGQRPYPARPTAPCRR